MTFFPSNPLPLRLLPPRLLGWAVAGFLAMMPAVSSALELGNLVFIDTNGNGMADPGEGVSDVQVQLFPFGADPLTQLPLQSRFTGGDGNYQFNGLSAGFYFVFIPPSEFLLSEPLHRMLSLPGDGFEQDDHFSEDGFDDEEPYNFGIRTGDFFLQAGQLPTSATYENGFRNADDDSADADGDLTIDFGFYRPVSIGNLVFLDLNGNGVADLGEGLPGVTVELFNGVDDPSVAAPVQSTVTGVDGEYLFAGLAPGSYQLRLPPSEFEAGGSLRGLTSIAGAAGAAADDDVGEDGLDTGNPLIDGVLTAAFSVLAGGAPTDSTGETGWAADDDDLTDDDVDLTRDFGLVAGLDRFGIGNLVFEDFNQNSMADEGEGIDGVLVQLFSAGMDPLEEAPLAQVLTGNGGRYRFGGLVAGDYFVHIPASFFGPFSVLSRATPLPVESVRGDDQAGQDGRAVGFPERVGVRSDTVSLSPGAQPVDGGIELGLGAGSDGPLDAEIDLTIDFGFVREVGLGLGNAVFYDANTNGVMDSGEGVAGVPLQLYREGENPDVVPPLDATVTQGGGLYLFSNLKAGRYFVLVPQIAFDPGQPLEGSQVIRVSGDDDGIDDDFGQNAGWFGNEDWFGLVTSVVELAAGTEPTATTGETGFAAGSDDFEDDLFDLTLDLGFRSPCSSFLMGPALLSDAAQGAPYSATFTSIGGVGPYTYSSVRPLPAGLALSSSGVLSGTPQVQGTFPLEIRAITEDGCTWDHHVSLTITPAAVQLGVGNLVFADANANGAADLGEGMQGVKVQLFADGQDPDSGVPMLETTTTTGGSFRFQGLLPGNYFLHVPKSQFGSGKPLYGFLSVAGMGEDDGTDDDADENGIDVLNPLLAGISSIVFELAAGTETDESGFDGDADAANDGDEDLTIDLGFVSACESIALSPGVLPKGWTSLPYDQFIQAGAGLAPYTFTAVSGLPGGFSLASDGRLTGTTVAAGSYPISINVVDARGCAGSGVVSLEVGTPPSKGKIGNVIFVDSNNNGSFDPGEGVDGVTVELMNFSAPRVVLYDSQVTDSQGRFLFINVDPGTYHLRISSAMFAPGAPLEGMRSMPGVSLGDDDVGEEGQDASEPAITGVVTSFFTLSLGAAPTAADGETGFEADSDDAEDEFVDLTRDLGFVATLPPASFSEWQSENGLGGQNAPLLNPDGDLHSNLIEYALLKSANSGLEFRADRGFRIEATGTGVTASYSRRIGGGSGDLIFTLEGNGGAGWQPLGVVPSVIPLDTSVEKVVFENIQTDPIYSGADSGRLRLRVGLDQTADSSPEEEDVTEAWTWSQQVFSAGVTRTLAVPFIRSEVFRGTAGSVNGNLVDLADALNSSDNVGFSMQQAGAGQFYVEVLSGPNTGHRLEVDESSSTVTAVAVNVASVRSTLTTAASLAGESVAIRRHWTLDSMMPKDALRATTSAGTADHILFFNSTANAFQDHWLLNMSTSRRWINSGDASFQSQGERVVGVSEGAFFTPRTGTSYPFLVGVERSQAVVVRLQAGTNFVGTPHLESASPQSWSMNSTSGFAGTNSANTADRIRVWLGESSGPGYGSYFYLKAGPFDQWAITGDAALTDYSPTVLFHPFRAAFIVSGSTHSIWKISPAGPPL